MADFCSYAMHRRTDRGASEFGRRALCRDRWAILVRHFDSVGPGEAADLQLQTMTLAEPIEIEGITFLPAVYYPA